MPRGAINRGIVTKRVTADYTVEEEIDQVLADASAAPITVTLVPRGGHTQRVVKVQNVGDGSFPVTVVSTGNKLINDASSYPLDAAEAGATFELDDLANWHSFVGSSTPAAFAATATNTLDLADDVADSETVSIGADVYEVEVVATDSTDNTASGNFNNTTDPLTVAGANVTYPGVFVQGVGDLVRIEDEIMRITVKTGTALTFQRGVSATVPAAHANALDIFIGDGIAGGSTVAVGLNTDLGPTAFQAALLADIASEGTEPITAAADGANIVITADAAGSAGNNIACEETLAGVGNEWENTTTFGGADASTGVFVVFEEAAGVVDSANTIFIFTRPPIFVVNDGAVLNEGTDYTLAGSTVTFAAAPTTGTVKGLVTV